MCGEPGFILRQRKEKDTMNIATTEALMYQVSGLSQPPVLLIITLLFFYTCFVFGNFTGQYLQRKRNSCHYHRAIGSLVGDVLAMRSRPVKGYRLFNHYQGHISKTVSDLELFALKELKKQRIVTRVVPIFPERLSRSRKC